MTEPNLFDLYFKYVAGTEPPAAFHRWSLIGCVGALLGRQMWFPFGEGRIFPNHYIMFVGDPGTRKSSAIKKATKLIGAAGFDKFGAQKTSMEKFLLDLQEDGVEVDEPLEGGWKITRGKKDTVDVLAALNLKLDGDKSDDGIREMFVAADEFNNFLGAGNLAFQSLLGELWDWDEPSRHYKQRLKNSKSVSIYQPTVSILAGNTPSSFADCFPLASIGQGFMSRLILVHAESSGIKVTFPVKPDEKLTEQIVTHLKRIKQVCQGPVSIDSNAADALDTIYKGWEDLEDARFKSYSTRRFTHLIKLLLVCAACRLSTKITIQDVLMANTILAYTESLMPKAIGELGKSRNSEAANKIMQCLYSAKDVKTMHELWKVVQNDLDKIGDLASLLINLQQADKIQIAKNSLGKDGYLAKQRAISRNQPYTNFDILRGKEYK